MPPDLVICPFCDRLYSNYSLKLHINKCFDNPLRKTSETKSATADKYRGRTSNENRLKPLKRRSRSASHVEARPKTHTITEPAPGSFRICFICGECLPFEKLLSHEKSCEKSWRQTRAKLPSHIRSRSPMKMQVPSVDGTVNIDRLNKYAQESADRCQKARCTRCSLRLLFEDALNHRCNRFEPSVEFYF